MENNKLIALTAIYKARAYQYALYNEQNKILAENKILWDKAKQTINDNILIKRVKDTIEKDVVDIIHIDSLIDNPMVHIKAHLPFSIQTNKMKEVLSGTNALLTNDETNIIRIANGRLPNDYDHNIGDELPELGKEGNYYGTSKSTFASCAIWYVHFALNNTNINAIDILNSAIIHVIALPSSCTLPPRYSWHYTNNNINGFGFVHSGYSFGGSRYEEHSYPQNKIFEPQDCSSFVNLVTSTNEALDTEDALCIYRSYMGGFIPNDWKETKQADTASLYIPVQLTDIQIGDIYFSRTFDAHHLPESSTGLSGHTAIVIDLTKEVVTTVGANRAMPSLEGIGIEDFPITSACNKESYFLRLRHCLPDPNNFKELNYNGVEDLPQIIQYFDQFIR